MMRRIGRIKPLAASIRFLLACSLVNAPLAQAELPIALPNGRWSGANAPQIINGGQDMLIEQIQERATLDWQSFDIGAGYGVRFDQPSSSSVALNRIYSMNPSIINGRLQANGQIYLINRNGILFGSNSQVDVNTLVASTLNIDQEVFEQGILSAIQNGQAAFVADAEMADSAGIEIQAGAQLNASQGEGGRIMILAPNILNAGDIRTPDGQAILAGAEDRVYLAQSGDTDLRGLLVEVQTGGDVSNVGNIVAERGNVSILGLSVNQDGLVRATSTATLNGSIRLVAGDNGGNASALEINTVGQTSSGVMDKLYEDRGGNLTLGRNSVTEILPTGTATVTDEQAQPLSTAVLGGANVTLESGARVAVTGGEVTIRARQDLTELVTGLPGEPEAGVGVRIESGAVIDVSGDDTTVVPVSRNVIEVEARGLQLADSPLQRDGAIRNKKLYIDVRKGSPFLNFDLEAAAVKRGVNERFSAGGTVKIDSTGDVIVDSGARIDISGGQVTYTGDLVSTSKLVTADRRVFDISEANPYRTYVGVLGQDLIIENAKWGRRDVYSAAGDGLFEAGYIEGKDAGSLLINARHLAFNGALQAGSVAGRLQRLAPSAAELEVARTRPFDQRPHGGVFSIGLSSILGIPQFVIGEDGQLVTAPADGEAIAVDSPTVLSAAMLGRSGIAELSVDTTGRIRVDAPVSLPDNGALRLSGGAVQINQGIRSAGGTVVLSTERGTVTSANGIRLPEAEVEVRLTAGAAIDVSGRWTNDSPRLNGGVPTASIAIDGGVIALESGGDLILESGSLLDVSAGAHLAADGELSTGRAGSITLSSSDNRSIKSTSRLSVEGELRGYAFEGGGALSITANDVLIASQTPVDGWLQQQLPDGSQRYALSGTGMLRSLVDRENSVEHLLVDPALFRDGGFQSFSLTATRSGLELAEGTRLALRGVNRILDSAALAGFINANPAVAATVSRASGGTALDRVPTGTALDAFTRLGELPEHLRSPIDLRLVSRNRFDIASSADYPVLHLAADTQIVGEPGAHIGLSSDTSLYVEGRIRAPAGNIALELVESGFDLDNPDEYVPAQKIWLGPQAELNADAAVVMTPNALGLRQGRVLDAGLVRLDAAYGSIVTASGSRISVDGVVTTLDIPSPFGGVRPTQVAGAAGAIHLTAAEAILPQGGLSGRAAIPNSAGGTLAVTLDPTRRPSESEERSDPPVPLSQRFPSGPRVINVAGFAGVLPDRAGAVSAALNGQAFVDPDAVVAGGFDALDLAVFAPGSSSQPDRPDSHAIIRFTDTLDLALRERITLDAPTISTTDARVQLSAAYVALGSTDTRFRLDGSAPIDGSAVIQNDPSGGAGQLRVDAGLIDLIGDTVLQGFGGGTTPATVLTSTGDIRLRGTLIEDTTDWLGSFRVAGDLQLQAQQIYPATLSDFTLAVETPAGVEGNLDILGQAGQPGQPLSAGGRVTLDADHIHVRSGARVRAPIGEIAFTGDNLNASGQAVGARSITLEAGSLLSTSATGLSIPFGATQFEKDLVLPVPADEKTLQFVVAPDVAIEKALPQKRIALKGDAIDVQPGALFDLSGGGDVRAIEFIPGTGGSKDILLADLDSGDGIEANGSFAILPLLNNAFAPYDPIESPAAAAVQGIRTGDTLVLEEGRGGLPAGTYAILPARYALFGGYLVTPVAGSQGMATGQNINLLGGTPVLAGRFGTAGGAADSLTQGFAIEDGTRVRLRAQYAESSLDSLFADAGVRTPRDAGNLTVEAQTQLRLAGTLAPTSTGGRGSTVDIVGRELSILSAPNGGGGIELLAAELQGLNADSLLIGATRSRTAAGLLIDPSAARIDVAAGVTLNVPELILVADQLNIGSGSTATRLTASGTDTRPGDTLVVDGDAAVAMVSVRRGSDIVRTSGNGDAELNLAAGATLAGSGSVVADADGNVNLAGTLDTGNGSLALGGATVHLGETAGLGLAGLTLSNAVLADLAGSDLSLRSSGAINVYGALQDAAGNAHNFQHLTLDGRGLVGRDSASARLAAIDLTLRNSAGGALVESATGTGTGTLQLQGERIALQDGAFTVRGYAGTALDAGQYVLHDGSGALRVEGGDLRLTAPLITAAGGADYAVQTTGQLVLDSGDTTAVLPQQAGLGAVLSYAAASIDASANIVLPSGVVRMNADGAVTLNSGAVIDVAGRDIQFASKIVGTPGGTIALASQTADVTINSGVTLDVSGANGGGSAGRIELLAEQGAVRLAPDALLRAVDHSGEQTGELVVNSALLASTDAAVDNALTSLNAILEPNGFRGRRDLRVREGDLILAAEQSLRARDIKLVADSGRIQIDGTLNASGADGGSIELAAGDALDINGTLDAHATHADGDGGRVELAALDADGDDLADGTRADVVNLNSGSVIDVRGGVNGRDGAVLMRALAYDGNADGVREAVALGAVDGAVLGAARRDIEAVQQVIDADGSITTADQIAWRSLLDQFMDNVAPAPTDWRIVPGLEVSSTGDLTLADAWDLYANIDDADPSNDWRFGADNDIPGILTLRAGGTIRINQSLSDVFSAGQFMINGIPVDYERLGTHESWRYRIVAGADSASADVLATRRAAAADILVAANTLVRSGSGDIDLAASRHVDFGTAAALYTAGLNSGFGPFGEETIELFQFINFDDVTFDVIPGTGEEFMLTYLNKGQFPIEGGDIRLAAGGDLRGQTTQVNITDWQPRMGGSYSAGDTNVQFQNLPVHWAIAFEQFKNGIGTLGGGDLTARVGGDMRNISLALPTTAKPDAIDITENTGTNLAFSDDLPIPGVSGGGDLRLEVGGNLSGGAFQIDRGLAQIQVGGDFGAADGAQRPYFAIADTQLNVTARGALTTQGVFNSTALVQDVNVQTARALSTTAYISSAFDYDPMYFTYGHDSSAALAALTGDITLGERAGPLSISPPTFKAHSLQAGITLDGELKTYPAQYGQLELLAEADIRHLGADATLYYIIQSDADPAQLPSVTRVVLEQNASGDVVAPYLRPPQSEETGDPNGLRFHATTPVHSGDTQQNLIVSRSGSIIGQSSPRTTWEMILAKRTLVSAGADIRDMSFRIQHVAPTDISLVQAGGDIVQTLSRDARDGSISASKKLFEIAGPGRLDVLAGGDIDLGGSRGIVAVGDTANPALADAGADILVMAGVREQMTYDAFIDAYLDDSALYLNDLNAFLVGRGIDAAGDPVAAFRALSRTEQRELILTVFFKELKEGGNEGVASGDYSRGFAAIATLFPEGNFSGDITTPVSVVKTEDDGNISMLAPYGAINAGATFRAIEKEPDDLGVIAGAGGDISIFLDGDLQVNRERVITLQGDLIGWSSNGDIDAGKGAKTIASAPDPVVTFDANGNAIVTFPPAVQGSGLSAVNGFLFAPRGAINAGDAGIRTSGNLTLGAVEVIGADNIDVGGVAVGVPTATASVPVGLGDASALSASASSLAEESTSSVGADGSEADQEALGLISVEVLGFGDEDDEQQRKQN